jgi:uncharacterized membrane protein
MTGNRKLGWLMLMTGIIGWLASGILALEKLAMLKDPNHTTVCDVNPWISCGPVMQRWQSSVFGFPNTAGAVPGPEKVARIPGGSGWIIVALMYVAVVASIFFAFIQVFAGTSGF